MVLLCEDMGHFNEWTIGASPSLRKDGQHKVQVREPCANCGSFQMQFVHPMTFRMRQATDWTFHVLTPQETGREKFFSLMSQGKRFQAKHRARFTKCCVGTLCCWVKRENTCWNEGRTIFRFSRQSQTNWQTQSVHTKLLHIFQTIRIVKSVSSRKLPRFRAAAAQQHHMHFPQNFGDATKAVHKVWMKRTNLVYIIVTLQWCRTLFFKQR